MHKTYNYLKSKSQIETTLKNNEDSLKNPQNSKKEAFIEITTNRRFEIEMYWKRAGYFWAFITSIYTAYFSEGLISNSILFQDLLKISLSFLGFTFCLGFLLANIGSKQWQENWEIMQGLFENEITGSIYKTFYYSKKSFSVSKINCFLSIILTIFSYIVFLTTLIFFVKSTNSIWYHIISSIILLLSILVIILLLVFTKGNKDKEFNSNNSKDEIIFKHVEYK